MQTYLASGEAANTRAKLGNWVSANNKLDIANVANPIDKLSVEILQDQSAVFRFDGSDLMPAAVGAGHVLEGHGRLDQRQEHHRGARLHRELLAQVVR